MRTSRFLPVVLLFALSSAALADSIVLKSVARLPAGTEVIRLADVAHLDGEEALRLADVELAQLPASGVVELAIDAIRHKLSTAGARWAVIDLSGRTVSVRAPVEDRPRAMTAMEVDQPPPPVKTVDRRTEFLAAEALGRPTPRGLIAELLVNAHAERGTRVKIRLDDVDANVLDDADPARRYEVVPMTALTADRVVVRVTTREEDRVISRSDVSMRPLLEVEAAVATRAIRRGGAFEPDAIEIGSAWVPPSEFARVAPPEQLFGAVASEAIESGSRVATKDLKRVAEIRKNERVTVRRELELVAIELSAIALEDGAVGDSIRFQIVDRKNRRDRRSFTAVVTGPGRAVLR